MSQAEILSLLLEHGGKLTRMQIVHILEKTPQYKNNQWLHCNITDVMQRLHKNGYIKKTYDMKNRKQVTYEIIDVEDTKKFLNDRNITK